MKILYFIIAFFVLFNFPVPLFYNSALIGLLLGSVLYLGPAAPLQKRLKKIFADESVIRIIFVFVCVIFLTIFSGFIHFTNDYSALKANILVLILFLIALSVYPFIESWSKGSNPFITVLQLIVFLFLAQSIIEILAFVFPFMADFVHFFQKDAISRKNMGGIRALGLTGNPFFDLSAGFGFSFIVLFKLIAERSSNSFTARNILIFAVLFLGSFFAGRTAFVGLGLGLALYFVSTGNPFIKLFNLLKIVGVFFILSLILFMILPQNVKTLVEENLLPFAFEFVYSYLDSGEVTTTSSEILDQMYFPIPNHTFWLGDGYYTGADGAYYMHTDAGIMRNILYYGVFGLILLIIGQLQFFRIPFKIIYNRLGRHSINKKYLNDLFFFGIIFLYILALHYKGEVILFLPILQILLIWLVLGYKENNKILKIED